MKKYIRLLRNKFKKYNIDGYVVPKNDDYFTEYSKINRLKIISNFSGSAGLAVIIKDKNKVGTIRYDKKEFYYEISISLFPKYQSKNIASKALKASEKILKKGMILSNIKKNNQKSLKFFLNNGYSVLSKDKKNILYKVLNNQESARNNRLIDKIQEIRKKNNVNWMDILRIAFESSPDKTKKVFKNIFTDDKNINAISKKLFS